MEVVIVMRKTNVMKGNTGICAIIVMLASLMATLEWASANKEAKMKRIAVKNLTWRQIVVIAGLGALIAAGIAVATPSLGITQVQVGTALYGDFHIKAEREGWEAELETKGLSDVTVLNATLVPGATSGWHSHPGLSLVSVTSGAVTLYDANDPNCTPIVVTAGFGFVEPGDHVHLVRNEGTVNATLTLTRIFPAGAVARIDQPRPPHCPVE